MIQKFLAALQPVTGHRHFAVAVLLACQLLAGLLTFTHYGLSWDEPLFYNYADSIHLAYTPQAWLDPTFDFEQVYGRSAGDHKTYGPAYILLARPVQQLIQDLGTDMAAAWHLVNFLTFVLGTALFYALALRWLNPWPALAAATLFALQPLLWGHAFINPKDIPFMVFFLAAVHGGIRLVDELASGNGNAPRGSLLAAGILLGLATAIRVIGPFAGVLVILYALTRFQPRFIFPLLGYAGLAVLVMLIFWPFLWGNPIQNLLTVFKHMSDNPTDIPVLFLGQIFTADQMPTRYFPMMLLLTLTEPVWPLAAAGFGLTAWRARAQKDLGAALLVCAFWFGTLFLYVVLRNPAVYDGIRHFLFILPPVFLLAGFALQWLWQKLRGWRFALVWILVLLPGLIGITELFPYEYAYYNRLAGGTGGAFRTHETEYWLTCYRESIEWVREKMPDSKIYVQRRLDIAEYYAGGQAVQTLDGIDEGDLVRGDILVFSTRTDADRRTVFRGLPNIHKVSRAGADFCVVKVQP